MRQHPFLPRDATREASVLHTHAHRLGRRHQHVLVQIGHDPHRAGDHHEYDEHAEGERQDIVGAFRPGGDVQEEHQVNAHLGDGEDSEPQEYAAWPEQRSCWQPRTTWL